MLPSGLVSVECEDGRISEIGSGLYVVEDAYKGDYDFFAPSRLYSAPQTTSYCQAVTSVDLAKK
jgi:hypothetical protein